MDLALTFERDFAGVMAALLPPADLSKLPVSAELAAAATSASTPAVPGPASVLLSFRFLATEVPKMPHRSE